MNRPATSRRLVAPGALEQLDQGAADDDRIGDVGHRPRRRRVADAEADADRQLHVRLDARDHRP